MKTKKTTDKIRVWSVGIVALLVVCSFIILAITTMRSGNFEFGIISIVIALVVLIFAIIFIKRQYSDVKSGFVAQDERSKKIMYKVGYYSFLITLWWLLILSWIADEWMLIQFRDVSQALGVGILGMAIIFGITWFFVSRSGKVE
ncbi:hypothetical protein GOV12_08130 [Candidatus Pacearchaeota archaeon]|nr:hypothetical protein [Candidatus Pacearchaeota archaeon]